MNIRQLRIKEENKNFLKILYSGREEVPKYMDVRTCKRCGVSMALNSINFHTNRNNKTGKLYFRWMCRSCWAAYLLERYHRNKDKQ